MTTNYLLPEETLQGILVYLGTRPYTEVAQGIASLTQLEKVKEEEDGPETE